MREIRLRWKDRVSHAEHEIETHARWTRTSAEIRRDLEIIVRTANELYGPRSHWIEEREARQPDRKARLRFDRRVLQGEAAASPYARQLMAGFPRLRFDAPLEREYADHVHDAQRRAALACGWLALALWLAWAGASAHAAVPTA
ncbi:hypothetical protein [Variovorax sp. PAMC 28711]|uniref:hypothetical protein n=1 Tax=Variovorax sp. PAMC 28711 TaxID=1795631 RepID=UPI00078DF522|nr:hypothetical protein [Variovorax sp. PAMC 28711]AMM23904.1 hypothetical protein AX767_05745 [Variovorax sp. PAMC 28711]